MQFTTLCRYGFKSFIGKMESRKELLKKVESFNRKTYSRSLPFFERIIYTVKSHKKKLIFFLLIGSLGVFYGYHRKLYYAIQRIEPISNKFDRWVLGIQNKKPSTIKQQDLRELTLSTTSQDRLLQLYSDYDNKLYYGIGRNMLFNIYSRIGLLQKDDEKRSFWVSSGYYRERNQKIAGVTCREFLMLFQEALQKIKKTNPRMNETELLELFTAEFHKEIPTEEQSQKHWRGVRQAEFSKVSHDDWAKEMFIADFITRDFEIQEKQVEQKTLDEGLHGLSVKDRHQLITIKLMSKIVDRHLLTKKISSSTTSPVKIPKYRQLVSKLGVQIDELKKLQQKLEEQYKQYYGSDMY